tara:strand:- start:401 stop:661 length:261 start_codon:yes stop_codon:yes gene_type:complete
MKDNVPDECSALCTPVALQMRQAFPELLLMSGEVVTESGQVYEHTWLQTEDGSAILDPTHSQFGESVTEYEANLTDSTDHEEANES